MITNSDIVIKFEEEQLKAEDLPLSAKFAILDGMHELAVSLHRFPPADILEGIEDSIHLSSILNRNVPTNPH